jgi:hypothetical protein
MTDWFLVLVPLFVLPIVLLFRFVGCGLDTKGEVEEIIAGQGFFPYKDMILDEPSVLAYWRLVDDPNETKAEDAKDSLDGEYKIVLPLLDEEPNTFPGSEAAAGGFFPNQKSLIDFDPAMCRLFNGGYVLVAKFGEVNSLGGPVVPYP